MEHKIRLTSNEKIDAWFNLCEFSYKLMKANLKPDELGKKLIRMRKEQLKKNENLLKRLAILDR